MSECPQLPTLEFRELAERVTASQPDGRWPCSGSLDLTARCNLRCRHCYMRPYRDEPELATVEVIRILREVVDAGCLFLLITGGEPLLRPDFLEIYRKARELGLIVTVFTNGTLVTESVARELAERPPLWVEVSLYGASEETVERVTGCAGAGAAALRGLRLLVRAGLHVQAKTVLLADNAGDLEAMRRIASDLGVNFRFNGEVFGRIGGDASSIAAGLPPDESVRIERQDPLHRDIWSRMLRDERPGPRRRLFRCRAGRQNFHVGPYGDLNICILMRQAVWSLRTGSFRQGWEEAIPGLLATPAEEDECDRCDLFTLCFPCPAKGDLESGDLRRKPEGLCRRTRAIARALREEEGVCV